MRNEYVCSITEPKIVRDDAGFSVAGGIKVKCEVVRCRDCSRMRHVDGTGYVCERLPFRFRTGPNMFCAWGEREPE